MKMKITLKLSAFNSIKKGIPERIAQRNYSFPNIYPASFYAFYFPQGDKVRAVHTQKAVSAQHLF